MIWYLTLSTDNLIQIKHFQFYKWIIVKFDSAISCIITQSKTMVDCALIFSLLICYHNSQLLLFFFTHIVTKGYLDCSPRFLKKSNIHISRLCAPNKFFSIRTNQDSNLSLSQRSFHAKYLPWFLNIYIYIYSNVKQHLHLP